MKLKLRSDRKHKATGVLCIGDAIDDLYIQGRYTRVSPEDPSIKIFEVRQFTHIPGGLLFAASNFRAMNRHILAYVQCLLSPVQQRGIKTMQLLTDNCAIRCFEHETIQKQRLYDDDTQQVIARFDVRKHFPGRRIEAFKHKFYKQKKEFLGVIVSDYQKGCVDEETIEYLKRFNGPFFIDTKCPDLSIWKDLPNAFVKINLEEFHKAQNKSSVEHLIVTAGAQGAFYYHAGSQYPEHFGAFPFEGKGNFIGAGDAFLAAFAGKMIETSDIAESIRYANIAARASLRRFFQYPVSKHTVDLEIENVRKLVA